MIVKQFFLLKLTHPSVAELWDKKYVEKQADGGTEDDLAYLDISNCGTCLGTEDDLRALFGGRNDLFTPVIYR